MESISTLSYSKSVHGVFNNTATILEIPKRIPPHIYHDELLSIKRVGPVTAKIIEEIVNTGKCSYYESLIEKGGMH